MAEPGNNNIYNVDSGSNINDKQIVLYYSIGQKDTIVTTGVVTGITISSIPYMVASLGFGTGGIIKSTIAAKTMETFKNFGATNIAAISGSISAACVSSIYYVKDYLSKIFNHYFNNNNNNIINNQNESDDLLSKVSNYSTIVICIFKS
ncbi:hypothetical protein ACTFIY_009350 [Dictyostelium cf. discoideum]